MATRLLAAVSTTRRTPKLFTSKNVTSHSRQHLHGTADDRGSAALMLVGGMHLRVDEERMIRTVARDVHEADQGTMRVLPATQPRE